MLKAINLHKSFGKREVVRGVTMQVEPRQNRWLAWAQWGR